MTKHEIPAEQWPTFMDQFSRMHHGKSAQVITADPVSGERIYAHDAPLIGIVDERHGRADEAIELSLGGAQHGAMSHSLPHPSRVSVAEWNDAYSAELEIESSEGHRMVIQVGPAEQTLPPDVVMDGILMEH